MARLREFAAADVAAEANSLLLVGPDGAGKTALLTAAAQYARTAGSQVIELTGARPYPMVRSLVEQLPQAFELLPAGHQLELRQASAGQSRSSARLAGATAALTLIRTAAACRPVLVAVDDAHLLDNASTNLLAFLARRSGAGMRLLLAARPDRSSAAERSVDVVLQIPPLSRPAADRLLRVRFPMLGRAARDDIVRAANGNPRALVEAGYTEVAADPQSARAPCRAPGSRTDDEAAALLEQAALHARNRGDAQGAAATLQQAADLSSSPRDRHRRHALAACAIADVTGDLATVERLLRGAGHEPDDAGACLAAVTAGCHAAMNGPEPIDEIRARLLRSLLDPDADPDEWVAEEAVWVLYVLSWYLNRPQLWTEFVAVVARHRARLPGWALLAGTLATGADPGRPDLALLAESLIASLEQEPRPWRIVRTALITRDHDRRFGWRQALQRVWADGTGLPVIYAGQILSDDAVGSGDWDTARRLSEAALRRCRELDYRVFSEPWLLYISARVAANHGDDAAVRRYTGLLLAWAVPRRAIEAEWRARHCRAAAALGVGDFARAHRSLRAIEDPGGYSAPAGYDYRVSIDFAEAAAGAGAADDVTELVSRLASIDLTAPDARAFHTAAAIAVATGDADAYERALTFPDADRWPFVLARVKLSYGTRLRANGSADAARTQLRAAADRFRHLGATPWLGRAVDQLRILGDVRDRNPAGGELTPMERRIAELAASGLTNRVIATELRIPAGTVGGQLSRVYGKLGVRSRAALRDALQPPAAYGPS